MSKKQLLLVVALMFALLILTSCGHTAKTEHWRVSVIDVISVASNEEITQMLVDLGYPNYCCIQPGPYLAVSVELKNISNHTLEYPPTIEGLLNGYIVDSADTPYHHANYGLCGLENNWVEYKMPLGEKSHLVRPGKSITDLYVFSVPPDASGLEMILTEQVGYEHVEASIKLGK